MSDNLEERPDGTQEEVGTQTETTTEERPAWLPLKFKTPEDLAKGYTALEKEFTKKRQTEKAGGLGIGGTPEIGDEATVNQIIEKAGLDLAELGATFRENGDLTDAQYAALKGVGYPRGIVKEFMTAQLELIKRVEGDFKIAAAKKVGGDAQLTNLLLWAKTNLTEEEKAWYNEQVLEASSVMNAFDWLVGKHREAVGAGKTASLIEGGGPSTSGGPFASQAEMIKAMNDPRYKQDRQYKAQVDARIVATEPRILHGIPAA